MRLKHFPEDGTIKLWLSSMDTNDWATRPGSSWPCSTLSGRRVFAEFEGNGDLVDIAIDGRSDRDCVDSHEFNCCTSDFIRTRLPDHPAIRG